jgi:exodeoxyribonuclease-3
VADPTVRLRVVSLNLRHGGGTRVDAIAAALARHGADIVVLPEYRANDHGARLMALLGAQGFEHQASSRPSERTNGVAVAARRPWTSLGRPLETTPDAQRVLEVAFDCFSLGAVYFPLNASKVTFWREQFLPLAHERLASPYLFVGDWNTGCHYVDETGATFFGALEFASMTSAGWTDAWRSLHPDGREYSWFSNRGNGFRLDHAFLSPSLALALHGAAFSQLERTSAITDHAALVIDLDLPPEPGRDTLAS